MLIINCLLFLQECVPKTIKFLFGVTPKIVSNFLLKKSAYVVFPYIQEIISLTKKEVEFIALTLTLLKLCKYGFCILLKLPPTAHQ